jgi:hypothetical protein
MMGFDFSGIRDVSENKYAAMMKEGAEGLSIWAFFLLIPFLIYHIIVNKAASLFSIKSLLVLVGAELVFCISTFLGSFVLSTVTLPILLPFVSETRGNLRIAQNIQTTILMLYWVSLLLATWFFAKFSVSYFF